jgi:cell wall-associated NlpC family hydrolase
MKYQGLPYRHHHIPGWNPPVSLVGAGNDGNGLDCSNFTSWVYDYGLGIKFTSDTTAQANGPGRVLAPGEAFAPGDLLFIRNLAKTKVTHVVIYIDPGHIIDCHGNGVTVRPFQGWYKNCFDHARRII